MVECTGLENRNPGNWIEGSNPSLSASRNAPTTGHFFRLEPVNLSGIQPDVESILPDAGKEQAASVFAASNAVVLRDEMQQVLRARGGVEQLNLVIRCRQVHDTQIADGLAQNFFLFRCGERSR